MDGGLRIGKLESKDDFDSVAERTPSPNINMQARAANDVGSPFGLSGMVMKKMQSQKVPQYSSDVYRTNMSSLINQESIEPDSLRVIKN